ncbi:Isocitrate/isopropylmalate dehydrogenase-domain-containing protein [Xylariaceae sp. AK1471]|nr:Isocitrate/isopropylmalate dehydrogenase-domain-containing protein [Xylariaceae sp. AK1471]
MSANQTTTSVPPTPEETPTSAHFSQTIFETPKANQANFDDSSGWTPRFAEEYSVFNTTPGNLRGISGPFPELSISTPYQSSSSHKRLLSAGSIAVEIASHVNHFSPTSTLPLPPVDPSRRLSSSPTAARSFPSPIEAAYSSDSQQRSGKKLRRGTLVDTNSQTVTPPPSGRKGERRLAPKPQTNSMQHEEFESEFVANTPQQQHLLGGFVSAPMVDMFGMPLSAPATAPAFEDAQSFWDTGMGGMDIDFSMPVTNTFQNPTHRPMDSLDWGKANEMFQETGVVPQTQENNPPQKKERLLAPKPTPMSNIDTSMTEAHGFAHSFHVPTDDPFATLNPAGGVDPGLLLTRPPSSHMELAAFDPMTQPILMNSLPSPPPPLPAPTKEPKRGQVRRSASTREVSKAKKDERPLVSSPVKTLSRPGLLRSASETRGRKPVSRTGTLSNLAPAIRNGPPANSTRSASQGSRTSGRTSPLKIHQRLSSLSSIPEHSGPRTRTSVRFTIDSRGRARAETTVIADGDQQTPTSRRRRGEDRRKEWESSEDESSSTDDEPIIIPSRNSSFALPEPRRPAYSRPSHTSQRSFSEQSTSSLGIYYAEPSSSQGDVESDAETVMNIAVSNKNRGDAMSELRKVREDRQKRVPALNTSHHFTSSSSFGANSILSPTSLGESAAATPSTDRGNQIRCVCNTTLSQINGDGYMVQCESCEMWLHGKCVKITRQTLPRVYICAFCANTPNAHGVRGRGIRRSTGGSNPRLSATSPLFATSYAKSMTKIGMFYNSFGTCLRYLDRIKRALFPTMASHNIVVFGGDHYGPKVVAEAVKMGTSGNLRPCFFPSESLVEYSPLKAEVCRGTDFTIPYSRPEIERIARLAAHLALARDPPAPVWSLDKANVLATSRLWRKVVTEVMSKEFPQLKLNHQLIDSAAMIMVKNPRGLNGIVVTSNLFGDIIRDEASVIPGSIGLSPSASLSGIPNGNRCNGIFEPIHGSAPDISGKGVINHIGTILSVAMMCRYSLRLPKEADAIEKAVRNVLDGGVRTKDMGGETGTKKMGDAVVTELTKLLKA